MKNKILQEKSYAFAIRVVLLAQRLTSQKEFILSNQILKSGTSIGANIREAEFAASPADFINKLTVSLKEANQTRIWLNLLRIRITLFLKNTILIDQIVVS
ncbi:MAG TPA: four helix bundle protein [Saprospiraceae bacterium]|nr:four helix bundle protein [Saprospiraceae bacterium]